MEKYAIIIKDTSNKHQITLNNNFDIPKYYRNLYSYDIQMYNRYKFPINYHKIYTTKQLRKTIEGMRNYKKNEEDIVKLLNNL